MVTVAGKSWESYYVPNPPEGFDEDENIKWLDRFTMVHNDLVE